MPNRKPLIGYRFVDVRAEDVDDDRRLTLSFASEYPVKRWWFTEILDHGADAVRMERMNDGAALLMDHDPRDQIGVIERAWIEDRRSMATVRFATTDRAEEALTLIRDKIRTKISNGYLLHRLVLEEDNEDTGEQIYRATDWEPLEISSVAVPADPTVGTDRSLRSYDVEIIRPARRTILMPPETTPGDGGADNAPEPTAPASATRADPTFNALDPDLEIQQVREDAAREARTDENRRQAFIRANGNLYPSHVKLQQLVQRALADPAMSTDRFTELATPLLESYGPIPEANGVPRTELGMERKEIERFSILRALRGLTSEMDNGKPFREIAPFEYECTRELEDVLDVESQGFFVPYDVQRGGVWCDPYRMELKRRQMGFPQMMMRAPPMDTGENVDLVPTDHLAGNYIMALRAQAIMFNLGAVPLMGLVGNVDIPGTDQNAGFGWIAEDDDSPDTEVTTRTVAMSPKTVSGSVPITRRLQKQSSPDVELIVREDLVTGAALAIDLAGFEGTGAGGQPEGVNVIAGTTVVNIATPGSPTWAEAVAFETAVAEADGLMGSLAYVTTATVRGNTKTTSKDAGSGIFVSDGNEMNGYLHAISTQLPANRINFGNWSDVLVGMWGVLDIRLDRATNAQKDRLTIRAFQDVDIGIRHAASFAKNGP